MEAVYFGFNSNPVNKKSEVLTKLKSLINKNESIRINNKSSASNGEKEELILDDHDYKVLGKAEISKNLYLSESQIYYLEHLEMSIKRSKIPFMLYIYDPNSPEKVNVDGLKHDATHILKDVVNLDKQVARMKYPNRRNLNTAEKHLTHPLGHLYKYIYQASKYFGQTLVKHMYAYSKTPINISKKQQ